MLADFLNAVQCLVYLLVAFPTERDGDDTDRKDIHFLCGLRDDGSGTGTSTTTHSCGDEYHLGAIVQHIPDVVYTFFCGFAGACRTVSGT